MDGAIRRTIFGVSPTLPHDCHTHNMRFFLFNGYQWKFEVIAPTFPIAVFNRHRVVQSPLSLSLLIFPTLRRLFRLMSTHMKLCQCTAQTYTTCVSDIQHSIATPPLMSKNVRTSHRKKKLKKKKQHTQTKNKHTITRWWWWWWWRCAAGHCVGNGGRCSGFVDRFEVICAHVFVFLCVLSAERLNCGLWLSTLCYDVVVTPSIHNVWCYFGMLTTFRQR